MRLSARWKFLIDLTFFVGFLLLMQPAFTGLSLHEWFSVALVAVMALHLLIQWDWIVQVTLRFFHKFWHKSRLQYVLDILLLVSMGAAFVSGFAISRHVLPFLGLHVEEDFFWRFLHSTSADLTLIIVAVHVALNWKWVVATFKSLFRRKQTRRGAQPVMQPLQQVGGER